MAGAKDKPRASGSEVLDKPGIVTFLFLLLAVSHIQTASDVSVFLGNVFRGKGSDGVFCAGFLSSLIVPAFIFQQRKSLLQFPDLFLDGGTPSPEQSQAVFDGGEIGRASCRQRVYHDV